MRKFVVFLIAVFLMISVCGCKKEETGIQTKGSFGYKMTYDSAQFCFKGGEIYDYFQCIDTVGSEMGQGIRVTRYEQNYSFDVIIDAINNQTERGLTVTSVIIGKKAYPASMVRFTFVGTDGKIYTECDYQITYHDASLLITAVYDYNHAGVVDSIIKSLDLN